MEIINPDQSAFLPLRFILDNVLLTQETLEWAEYSNQPLVFLKLDFSKAYDTVDLPFLFGAMAKFGFPAEFIDTTKLLFQDATACVKVNGAHTATFPIERDVRQGCPLAPYLFLIVAEVMNAMVKSEVASGLIRGITLPDGTRQQVIAQYADDTSLTLRGEEEPVRMAIFTLEVLCASSGLTINWSKSCGYWKLADGSPRPAWTDHLGIPWATNEDVCKLLGTAFGLSLSAEDSDEFLLARINNSLGYWSATKVNSTGRGIVVNSVLLSSTYYFTSIWGGTKKGVAKIKSVVTNYLWSGTMNRSRSKVFWLQCCQPKDRGGVNLINPTDEMTALMTKWIMKAVEPGDSNLHLLLRFRLKHFQPYSGGRWAPSLEFFTLAKFQARKGSKAWTRAGLAWRCLVKELSQIRPTLFEEVMSESFWWSEFTITIGPGFSKNRASQLHRAGLQHIRDAWEDGLFISTERASEKFGLLRMEHGAWTGVIDSLSTIWAGLLGGAKPTVDPQEWLGLFCEPDDGFPKFVLLAGNNPELVVGLAAQAWKIPLCTKVFVVQPLSRSLVMAQLPETCRPNEVPCTRIFGRLCRVRVSEVTRGPKKTAILICYSETQRLSWDPAKFSWPKQAPPQNYRRGAQHHGRNQGPITKAPVPFLKYTAKMGRNLL
jgi:hypothetical protein